MEAGDVMPPPATDNPQGTNHLLFLYRSTWGIPISIQKNEM